MLKRYLQNNIPEINALYFLAHYYKYHSRHFDDVSQSLLDFKDGKKEAVNKWSLIAANCFRRSQLKVDIVIRALGSGELTASGNAPLDKLGKTIAIYLNAPYKPDLLSKKRTTRPLKTLSTRQERIDELADVFIFNTVNIPVGSHLLIVDDILTASTTASEIARTIRNELNNAVLLFFSLGKTTHPYFDGPSNNDDVRGVLNEPDTNLQKFKDGKFWSPKSNHTWANYDPYDIQTKIYSSSNGPIDDVPF